MPLEEGARQPKRLFQTGPVSDLPFGIGEKPGKRKEPVAIGLAGVRG